MIRHYGFLKVILAISLCLVMLVFAGCREPSNTEPYFDATSKDIEEAEPTAAANTPVPRPITTSTSNDLAAETRLQASAREEPEPNAEANAPVPKPVATSTSSDSAVPTTIPAPTFTPVPTLAPATYSVQSGEAVLTRGGHGLIHATFPVTLTNVGERLDTMPLKVELAVGDDYPELISLVDPPAPGQTLSLDVANAFPPGYHSVRLIAGASEVLVDVDARAADITLEALGHSITGDGLVALEVLVTNQGNQTARAVVISAHRQSDTAVPWGEAVVDALDHGQSSKVLVVAEIPAGSYAIALSAVTDSLEAFQDNNYAEMTVEVDYAQLSVRIDSVRHVGYHQNGDGVVEMALIVANNGAAASRELIARVFCADGSCSGSIPLESIGSGEAAKELFTAVIPAGVTNVRVFIDDVDNGQSQDGRPGTEVTVRLPERATVSSSRDRETVTMAGYWSDGTANIEVTPSQHRGRTQGIIANCIQESKPANACDQQALVWPSGSAGPTVQTRVIRLPMGETYTMEFDYGDARTKRVQLEIPERILGVEREVWECFSDTSNAGTDWWGLGIGCAGWSRETIAKWDQDKPVRVWAYPSGSPTYIRMLKEVLDDLSPIVNLQFQWVSTESEADFVAYVGLYRSEAQDVGVGCGGSVAGCVSYAVGKDGMIRSGRLIALGRDTNERKIKSLILHEILHVLTSVSHRQRDTTSVMSYYSVVDQSVLHYMDEALFRLYSHPLVKPGMGIDRVRQLIVFRDELLDQPAPTPLTPAQMLGRAYANLLTAGSARYTITWNRYSYWPNYEVANYQFERPRWTHVNDGSNHYYMIDQWDYEMWRQVSGNWRLVNWSGPAHGVPADVQMYSLLSPHFVLTLILEELDRVEVKVLGRSGGEVTIEAKFDPGAPPGGGIYAYSSAEVVVVLDEHSYEVREYSFKGPGLRDFHAHDGRYGIEFVLPGAVMEVSSNISSCRPEVLGLLSKTARRIGRLPGSCGFDAERNLRRHHFSLDRLTDVDVVMRMISENLDAYGDGSLVALRLLKDEEILESTGLFQIPGELRLGNVQLTAGDYIVELEAFDPGMRLEYEVEINSPQWPKAVLDSSDTIVRDWQVATEGRVQSIGSGAGYICSLNIQGKPSCWGSNTNRQTTAPEEQRFTIISTGWVHACGLREDGSPACWGNNYSGEASPPADARFVAIDTGWGHTCGVTVGGHILCWGSNEHGQSIPPTGKNFTEISAGWNYACALQNGGVPVCWGEDTHGRLAPPITAGLRNISIGAGGEHACGLRADGTAACWGNNGHGQSSPPLNERFTTISSGSLHTCALKMDGVPVCWGYDEDGRSSPSEGKIFVDISSSSGHIGHSCGVTQAGAIFCWGAKP